jgi:hypothetical protein
MVFFSRKMQENRRTIGYIEAQSVADRKSGPAKTP